MIQDAQNKTNIESHLFTYLNDQNCLEIQGGLWNYLLDKKLEEISNKVFENSTIIMQVNDIYTNVNNNLIRSLSIGKTNPDQIQLKEFLLPKFEKK